MDTITLGQIALGITFIVGLITGIAFLHNKLKEWLQEILKDQFSQIKTEISGLSKKIEDVDMNTCKNFLVRTLSDIENEQPMSETELERFWEQYEHYTTIGGNSYIKNKVDKLKAEGKL